MPQQQVAALESLSRRNKEFSVTFSNGRDRYSVASRKDLPSPGHAWIDGDWDGTPIHALADPKADLSGIARLDLRSIHWLKNSRAISGNLGKLRQTAKSLPVLLVKRVNSGVAEGELTDWDTYSSRVVAEPIALRSSTTGAVAFSIHPPNGAGAPEVLSDLAGWALPETLEACGKQARYTIGDGVEVLLRTQSFASMPTFDKAEFTGSRGANQPRAFWSAANLSVPAAKYLAAAMLINLDHYFVFTPSHLQERAFNGIVKLAEECKDADELLLRANTFLMDPHGTVNFARGNTRITATTEAEWAGSGTDKVLPALLMTGDGGSLYVIRAFPMEASAPLLPGDQILSIEGQSAADISKAMMLKTAGRVENAMAPTTLLAFPEATETVRVRWVSRTTKATIEQAVKVTTRKDRPPAKPLTPTMPKGWTYVTAAKGLGLDDLLNGLDRGENYLLDFRFGVNAYRLAGAKRTVPLGEDGWFFIKTPTGPSAWGTNPDSELRALTTRFGNPGMSSPKRPKGRVICLVWGLNQSVSETMPLYLKLGLGDACQIVGMPTSGTTGFITNLAIPTGYGNTYFPYSPTGGYSTFGNISIQYCGVPLDLTFTRKQVIRASARGGLDPLLDLVIDAIPGLPKKGRTLGNARYSD